MKEENIKEIVKKHYGKIANSGGCCSCSCGSDSNTEIAKSIGYSDSEIKSVSEANLGLGCGNPTAMAMIKEGDIVLDLGSGAGFDCFLAAKKTGKAGRVIGIDFAPEMIAKAQSNLEKYDYENVEFRLGDIENMPVENDSANVVISNCVINLAPDKTKVFKEIFRVLKNDGAGFISDIVLLEELSKEQKEDEELLSGCVGGALLKDDYLKSIQQAGLSVEILSEDKDISKRQYDGIALESLKIKVYK